MTEEQKQTNERVNEMNRKNVRSGLNDLYQTLTWWNDNRALRWLAVLKEMKEDIR